VGTLRWLSKFRVYWLCFAKASVRLGPPLPRGRAEIVAPSVVTIPLSKSAVRLGRIADRQKKISPCFGSGPGDRPHSSFSPPSKSRGWRADKAHGLDRQARSWPDLQRALGVKRHAPRLAARQRGIFGLRLNQRSGRTRSYLSLEVFSRGRPWVRVRSCLPAGAAPGPRSQDAS
jgi:hypothetical protein